MDQSDNRSAGGAAFLLRIYWMFAGPAAIFLCIVGILEKKPAFPSYVDGALGLAVASLLLARYIDIRFWGGNTAEGTAPASMADFRRFTRAVLLFSLLAWALVRVGRVLIP